MKPIILLFYLCFIAVTGSGCQNKRITRTDTPTSGVAVMVSDDCFGNITQEEVDVFEALNREASVLPIYTDEAQALKLLLTDSVRLAILARDLTDAEKESIHAKNRELVPRSQRIAIDGIALIVSRENPLTRVSIPALRKVMTGQSTSWRGLDPSMPDRPLTVVFDNPNSSTARFIRDSICAGEAMQGSLFARKNSLAVIDEVSRHPLQLSFNQAVKVLAVSRFQPATADNSYLPVPAYLYLRNYPLTRDVYAVLTDLRGTLPAGFTHFVAGDRGQRIILKSGLVPATRPIRTVEIKETF